MLKRLLILGVLLGLAAGVTVPVISIGGNESPVVREAALNSGCIAFLKKPFDAQSLIEQIERAFAKLS